MGCLNMRFYNYLGRYLNQIKLSKKISGECYDVDIIWSDSSIFSLRLVKKIKKNTLAESYLLSRVNF